MESNQHVSLGTPWNIPWLSWVAISNVMKIHWIPWNLVIANLNGIRFPGLQWNFLKKLMELWSRHFKFQNHSIEFHFKWHRQGSMEFSMELCRCEVKCHQVPRKSMALVAQFRTAPCLQGIRWNISWNFMELVGGLMKYPWKFHGTMKVPCHMTTGFIEIPWHIYRIPWNCAVAKSNVTKFHEIPWNFEIHFESHFDIMFLLARFVNFHGRNGPLYSSTRIFHLMICA